VSKRQFANTGIVSNAVRILIADIEAQNHVRDGLIKFRTKASNGIACATQLIGHTHSPRLASLGINVSDRLRNVATAHAGTEAQLVFDVSVAGKEPSKDGTLVWEDPECLNKHLFSFRSQLSGALGASPSGVVSYSHPHL
jgi:hypothetical protein